MWKLYIECYTKKYFDFKGRASRKEYISFILFSIILRYLTLPLFLIFIIKYMYTNIIIVYSYLILVYLIITFIPALSLGVRRLHDFNFRFRFVILAYVLPFLIIAIIEFFEVKVLNFLSQLLSAFFVLFSFFINIMLFFKKGSPKANRYGEPIIR
jgi:uncharacterized membrane protein YhaH (DUF805 family)